MISSAPPADLLWLRDTLEFWVLNEDKTVRLAASREEYSENQRRYHTVAADAIGDRLVVSTMFAGADMGIRRWFNPDAAPVLFETMAFTPNRRVARLDGVAVQFRYATWEEALEGHARVVSILKHRHRKPSRVLLAPPL